MSTQRKTASLDLDWMTHTFYDAGLKKLLNLDFEILKQLSR